MTTEKDIERRIIMQCSRIGSTVFDNEVGAAWLGEMIQEESSVPRKIVLRNCRRVKYGLMEGSSDLIGWTPVKITEDMVGSTLAVFTAIEVKKDVRKSYKKSRMESQQIFINVVNENGGIAFKSDSPEEIEGKIKRVIDSKRKV